MAAAVAAAAVAAVHQASLASWQGEALMVSSTQIKPSHNKCLISQLNKLLIPLSTWRGALPAKVLSSTFYFPSSALTVYSTIVFSP